MKYSMNTDPGKRIENQDFTASFFNKTNIILSILCDGLGGHQAGDIASEMAVSQIGNAWEKTTFKSTDTYLVQKWLDEKINEENTRIYEASNTYSDLEGMGTTLVASVVLDNQILIANIGDSRAYVFQEGYLELVTEDHSFVSELQRRGEISDDEAMTHYNRNALTRSLGVNSPVDVDFFKIPTSQVDLIMLNSDGVSNTLTKEEMIAILNKENTLDEKSEELIQTAVLKEASDNVTVTIIQVHENLEKEAGE